MMAPVYRNEVTQDDVGARVTMRHWIDDPDRGRVPTDVVGELVAADELTFTVQRRNGDQVVVARATLLASKLLPPAPDHRRRRTNP